MMRKKISDLTTLQKITNSLAKLPLQTRVFIILAFSFGTIFVFANAPMKVNDEPQHYWRAYEVSQLSLTANHYSNGRYGYPVPMNMLLFGQNLLIAQSKNQNYDTDYIKSLSQQKDYGKPTITYFDNSAVYSPVGYIPQAVGLRIGSFLKLPVLQSYYLGRLLNLYVWLVLVAVAISITPIYRWVLVAVSLLPMTLLQAASYSPDALTNGLAVLTLALFFFLLKKAKPMSIRELLITLLVITGLALTKQVYSTFALLFIFLPRTAFRSQLDRIMKLGSLILVPLTLVAFWAAYSSGITKEIPLQFRPNEYVNSTAQISYIFHHIINFISTVIYTVFYKQFYYLFTGTLASFNWGTVVLPFYCYLLLVWILIISALKDAGENIKIISKRIRIGLASISFLTFLGVITSLYVGFTVVGLNYVQGLQGRYFIPVLLLFIPAIITKRYPLRMQEGDFMKILITSYVIVLGISSLALLNLSFFHILPPIMSN